MAKSGTTKEFSNKQESLIASYLGWEVVTGSGARRHTPGDVKGDGFLGECKTHMTPTPKVKCMLSEWEKICQEAMGTFNIPVMFCDNGTQKAENTWCVVPAIQDINYFDILNTRLVAKPNIIFDNDEMKTIYNVPTPRVIRMKWGIQEVAIIPLKLFKEIFVDKLYARW